MNIRSSYLDLGEIGSITTYELSGDAGEIAHEFSPLEEHTNALALFIAEGAQIRESFSFEQRAERQNIAEQQFRSGLYQGSTTSLVAVPLSPIGGIGRFRYLGNQAVVLHVAVLKRTGRAIQQFLQRNVVDQIIRKFTDKCWACKKLVRFLLSLLISGGIDVDTDNVDDVLDAIGGLLPEDWREWLEGLSEDSDLVDMLRRIWGLLRRLDPRSVIAEQLCTQLGFCGPPGIQQPPPPGDNPFREKLVRLKSLGITDPDIDLMLGIIDGNKSQVEKAIEDGANVNITDLQLLERYKNRLLP